MGILVHVTKWGFLYHFNKREQDLYSGLLKKSESRLKHYDYLLVGSEEKTSSLDEAKLICKPVQENACFEQALKQKLSESVEESSNTIVMEDTDEESVIDEELNRKVEAFIVKFNRQMRLQRLESLKRHHQIIVE
ncbi:hypothetical protein SUGI_1187260 [Cryptomeria japonica]|nr:hypothetical protein SUGI_1187260 [Cryptomeria japonica]